MDTFLRAVADECALVLDFFVRHGILNAETEPHLDEIRRRTHRGMPFPGPHKEHEKADAFKDV